MERITLLSIAIFLFASITKAQITKGSTFIGGQISGSTYKQEDGSITQKQSSFVISPAIGTAIKQNLIAGIDLTYAHTKYGYTPDPVEGNSFGAGFFLRRYAAIANRFYFFLQGRAGYYHDKSETSSGSNSYKNVSDNYSLGLYPGISYALTKCLHIEAGLNNLALINYSHGTAQQTGSPDRTSNSFGYSTSATGSNLAFALRFIIPKK
jgi:long-subunit fatty acid transport protein